MQTATTRPTRPGRSFTRWSIRKLAACLRKVHGRVIRIGREALRCLLAGRSVTFQRTKTWKESPDLERNAEPDRIEEVLKRFPQQDLVVKAAEAVGDVPFDEPGRPGPGVVHLPQSGMAAPAGTKPMRAVGERRLVICLQ